jgi:flavodoxin
MYQVSREYWNDVDEDNCWNFSLENAKALTHCCFELGRFTKFKTKTPKLTNAYCMFTGDNGRSNPQMTEIEMDYDNLTSVYALFYGLPLKDLPANFNPKTRNLDQLLNGTSTNIAKAHGGIFPFYEVINEMTQGYVMFCTFGEKIDERYTFENCTNATGIFFPNVRDGILECPKNLSFKNVVTMNTTFCRCRKITSFQTKYEMSKLTSATNAFNGCTSLSLLYPDYESFSWPKLSNATGMFTACILDKPSIIKLSNALPDWSNDTATHNITIGCHIDHKHDPEVNLALKKLQSSYTTPIEELGATLPEEVTNDKGWTIAVQWNGTATENAYPAPTV